MLDFGRATGAAGGGGMLGLARAIGAAGGGGMLDLTRAIEAAGRGGMLDRTRGGGAGSAGGTFAICFVTASFGSGGAFGTVTDPVARAGAVGRLLRVGGELGTGGRYEGLVWLTSRISLVRGEAAAAFRRTPVSDGGRRSGAGLATFDPSRRVGGAIAGAAMGLPP